MSFFGFDVSDVKGLDTSSTNTVHCLTNVNGVSTRRDPGVTSLTLEKLLEGPKWDHGLEEEERKGSNTCPHNENEEDKEKFD